MSPPPVGTWTYNRSYVLPAPLLSVSNTSTGVTFLSPTTGYAGQNIKLSWSQTAGFRGSRYYQLFVSTNGAATVSVSSSGLIDFRTIDGNWVNFATGTAGTPANFAAGFVDTISYTLPTGYVTSAGSGGQTRLDLVTVTAVPEPSTIAMALAGLACSGFSMWRRRKRA